MIFRFKVFLPALLITLLIGFILVYRIDAWVKDGLEEAISMVSGTKTDIHSLHLSFRESRLSIKRLEIASPQKEFENLLEFEDMKFDFQFLPLLKKRVVVDEFSIRGVKWGTKRTTSGKLPPRPPSQSPAWFKDLSNAAVREAKREFEKMPVSQLTDFRIPESPREILDKLNLKSEAAYKKVASDAQELRGAWASRVADLSDLSRYQSWLSEVQRISSSTPNDPQALLQSVERIQQLIKNFEEEQNRIKNLLTSAEADFARVQNLMKEAGTAFHADLAQARKLASFDDLNLQNVSKLLFGELWLNRVEEVLRYRELMRRFLAAGKSDESVQVRPRARGRDIVFVTPRLEPDFILAKSEFSVEGIEGKDRRKISQLYKLKVHDLNSAPKIYGKPSSVFMEAAVRDFIFQRASFEGFWDYTKDIAKDRYELTIEKLKVDDWFVGIPVVFPMKIRTGESEMKTRLNFEGNDFSWKSELQVRDVVWDSSEIPRVGLLVKLLEETFRDISSFQVAFEMSEKASKMTYSISSDLDTLVKASVERRLQKQFDEFYTRLEREFGVQLARIREQADKELGLFKSHVTAKVSGAQQSLDQYLSEASKIQAQLKARAERLAKQKVQQELQKLPVPDSGGLLKKVKPPF